MWAVNALCCGAACQPAQAGTLAPLAHTPTPLHRLTPHYPPSTLPFPQVKKTATKAKPAAKPKAAKKTAPKAKAAPKSKAAKA